MSKQGLTESEFHRKKIFKAILTLKIKKTFLSSFLFLFWELLMNKLILRFLFFCFEKNIRPLRYNAVITWCDRSCNNWKHVCLMWYWSSHLLFLFVCCVLCLFVCFFVVWSIGNLSQGYLWTTFFQVPTWKSSCFFLRSLFLILKNSTVLRWEGL